MAILFDWDALSNQGKKAKMIAEVVKKFKAQHIIITKELTEIGAIKTTAGMKYRDITFVASDSQKFIFSVKETGDIWKVKIANERNIFKEFPIKNQQDHDKAIGEIARKLVANRTVFQKRLAAKQKNDLANEVKKEVKEKLTHSRVTEKSLQADLEQTNKEIAEVDVKIATLKQKSGLANTDRAF